MMSFVCLLSTCSHANLVDEGMCCYASMVTNYSIYVKFKHYISMVNLFKCANHLYEAKNMFMAMPCKPNVTTWIVLLGI
jgi:hypothetical protein